MTSEIRSAQEVLADQFRLTARISALTGDYHRLLQKLAAAGFARQMAEDGTTAGLAEAEQAETAAKQAAETCEAQIAELEDRLLALGQELAALT